MTQKCLTPLCLHYLTEWFEKILLDCDEKMREFSIFAAAFSVRSNNNLIHQQTY